jgi:restriction endonuclease
MSRSYAPPRLSPSRLLPLNARSIPLPYVYILLLLLAALAGAVVLSWALDIISRTFRWALDIIHGTLRRMSITLQATPKRNEVPVAAARAAPEVVERAKSLGCAMQKPQAPVPEHFGTTAAEIASTPSWERLFFWYWPILIAACELWEASKLGLNDWVQHWPAYLFAGFFGIVIFAIPTAFAAAVLCWASCFALHPVLLSIWPQYQRVAQFHAAQAKYPSDLAEYNALLAEYNAWVLRQREQFWRSLGGISFEHELGQLFKKIGYQVKTTPHTADGGVDLILERSGQRIVVQCKSHASKVGIATARELVASMIDFQAQKGILAVTSGVTKNVEDYVKSRNIEIYDLPDILSLQREHG